MAIQKVDPVPDLHRLHDRVNRVFDEVLSGESIRAAPGGAASRGWSPPTDVFEGDDRYVVVSDLPGVSGEHLEVVVENGRLVVRGERRRDVVSYLRSERPEGRFRIEVALPGSIDKQRIHASHREGVLEIVLPKRRDDAGGRIEVAVD